MEEKLFESTMKKFEKKHLRVKDYDLYIDNKYEVKEISKI
jgi:hypothetical protein